MRSRVIDARMCSSSGGVQSAPSASTQNSVEVGRLEHAAVGRDEQRLVEAALLRQPRAEHVAAVGERLDPVEHARGRVRDEPQPDAGRLGRRRLGEQQPPAAARDHDAQRAVELAAAARGQQLRDLALQLGSEDLRQAKVRARTLEPVEVVGEREGHPVVDADHLEHAVAAQQALVGGGDGELVARARCARRASPARRSSWRCRLPCRDLLRRRATALRREGDLD